MGAAKDTKNGHGSAHPPQNSSTPVEHTPLRLAEKHYKNRSLAKLGLTPSLRAASTSSPYSLSSSSSSSSRPLSAQTSPALDLHHPEAGQSSFTRQQALDLGRPEQAQEDEVYLAGWWSPENDAVEEYLKEQNGQTGGVKGWLRSYRKGKERDLGERPGEVREFRRVQVGDKWGYVVAEGCILIPQYLSPSTQLSLARSALSSYTLAPNPLSLSTHYSLPPDLFSLYAAHSPQLIPPLFESLPAEEQAKIRAEQAAAVEGRKTIETAAAATIGYEEAKKRNERYVEEKGGRDRPSGTLKGRTAGELMREIRWANLGWVYQWTTKSYDFAPKDPVPFPQPLAELCSGVVRQISWGEVYEGVRGAPDGYDQWAKDYVPDTGIVNFYQSADTLMAHVDRAELDPARPLVSISLGHPCIFLLGTSSRHSAPLPIILRSGDVFIMSGKGRQAYHGVPRIMERCLPKHFHLRQDVDGVETDGPGDVNEADEMDETNRAVREWIASARINVNVRQVFPPGFRRPGHTDTAAEAE